MLIKIMSLLDISYNFKKKQNGIEKLLINNSNKIRKIKFEDFIYNRINKTKI